MAALNVWRALLLFCFPLMVMAADESTTAYAALYQALAPKQDIERYDRLRPVQRIQSKRGAAANDIRLSIHSRNGAIEVPVHHDGTLDFPLNERLMVENPAVVTNQPKGSLTLTVTFELKLPAALRIPYAEITAALDQARAVVANNSSGINAEVVGVEFQFSPGVEASVTVSGKSDRILFADAGGRLIVMYDDTLVKENPMLVFSRLPDAALPFLNH